MIEIEPGFYYHYDADDVPSFPGLSGGLRVAVDGEPITRFTPETEGVRIQSPVYRATGTEYDAPAAEFIGTDLELTLSKVFGAFEPFLTGGADRHEEYVASLFDEPAKMKLVLSQLDGDRIRIAALPGRLGQPVDIPVESQLGAAVDPAAFAVALADCLDACLEFIRRAFTDVERDVDFTPEIEELETHYGAQIDRLREMA